jgi:hypothetical protein
MLLIADASSSWKVVGHSAFALRHSNFGPSQRGKHELQIPDYYSVPIIRLGASRPPRSFQIAAAWKDRGGNRREAVHELLLRLEDGQTFPTSLKTTTGLTVTRGLPVEKIEGESSDHILAP